MQTCPSDFHLTPLWLLLLQTEMARPLAQGGPPSVVTQQMAQRQNHPTQPQTQR